MPNKERIYAWLEELRSGKWKQGKGMLHTKYADIDELCCLGVACAAHPEPLAVVRGLSQVRYNSARLYLPLEVAKYLDITAEGDLDASAVELDDPVWALLGEDAISFKEHPSLAALNDAGLTFVQIADFIERNMHTLDPCPPSESFACR